MAGRIPAADALPHQFVEKFAWRRAVGRMERRELEFAQVEIKLAAVGNLDGVSQEMFPSAIDLPKFRRNWKMEVATRLFPGMFLSQQGQGADALDDIEFPAVGPLGVVDRRTGHLRLKVEPVGKQIRQPPVGADGEEAVGVESA